MKVFIQVLDNGYTLSVNYPAIPATVDRPETPERKQKFAYETQAALVNKLIELNIVNRPAA